MTPVEYVLTDVSALESIRPLWNQLNEHNLRESRYFRAHYEHGSFDDRKTWFENLARNGSLRVEIARDPDLAWDIGYCISSMNSGKPGEIESIFVLEAYRNRAIGSTLVNNSLMWMGDCGAARIRVSIADGNESASAFYKKPGSVRDYQSLKFPVKWMEIRFHSP